MSFEEISRDEYPYICRGFPCRILASDLKGNGNDCFVIAFLDNGKEFIDNVSAKFITIRPAPKKRIQGWIVINHGDHGQLHILPAIYGSKELAQKYADSRTSAITYIDTEEGKWDLK